MVGNLPAIIDALADSFKRNRRTCGCGKGGSGLALVEERMTRREWKGEEGCIRNVRDDKEAAHGWHSATVGRFSPSVKVYPDGSPRQASPPRPRWLTVRQGLRRPRPERSRKPQWDQREPRRELLSPRPPMTGDSTSRPR